MEDARGKCGSFSERHWRCVRFTQQQAMEECGVHTVINCRRYGIQSVRDVAEASVEITGYVKGARSTCTQLSQQLQLHFCCQLAH